MVLVVSLFLVSVTVKLCSMQPICCLLRHSADAHNATSFPGQAYYCFFIKKTLTLPSNSGFSKVSIFPPPLTQPTTKCIFFFAYAHITIEIEYLMLLHYLSL